MSSPPPRLRVPISAPELTVVNISSPPFVNISPRIVPEFVMLSPLSPSEIKSGILSDNRISPSINPELSRSTPVEKSAKVFMASSPKI